MAPLLCVLGTIGLATTAELLLPGGTPRPLAWCAVLVALPASVVALHSVTRGPRLRISAQRLRAIHGVLFLGTYFGVLCPLGWTRWVLIELRWYGVPFFSLIFLLLPAMALSLSLAPLLFWTQERTASSMQQRAPSFRRWFLRSVGLVSVPLGVFCGVVFVASYLWELPLLTRAGLTVSKSFEVASAVVLFLLLFAASPFLIQLAWPARELAPGALRDRLEALTRRLRMRLRTIGVCDDRTRYSINACAVGLLPGTRSVLFTQGLRDHLTDDDIIAVFSHELAHLKRRHLVSYALLATVFLLSLAPFERVCEGMHTWIAGGLFAAYALVYWGFIFGFISRRLELEADLTAVDMSGFNRYATLLKKMSVLLGPRAKRAGWRHASVERRLAFLHATADSPEVRLSFVRTARRLRTGIHLLLVLALGGWLGSVVTEFRAPQGAVALERAQRALEEAVVFHTLLERPASARWFTRGPERVQATYHALMERTTTDLELAAGDFPHETERLRGILEGLGEKE